MRKGKAGSRALVMAAGALALAAVLALAACSAPAGENGGMACKQKRRMYLLREGEMLPIIMTLPTGSLAEFTKYVTRLVTRGMKANHVVTKFSLKRAQNSTGINYSQVICSVDRPLSPDEKKNIASMTEQIKLIAGKVSVAETETAAE